MKKFLLIILAFAFFYLVSPFYVFAQFAPCNGWWTIWDQLTAISGAAEGVTVDSSGVYFAGYQNKSSGDTIWRVEKRTLDKGSLSWQQTFDVAGAIDGATGGVAVDSSGVYIAGVQSEVGQNGAWRIEKRNLTNGSLVWSKSGNLTSSFDRATGVAVNSSGVYIRGVEGWTNFRLEKRSLADGALIWAISENRDGNGFGIAFWPQPFSADDTGIYIGHYYGEVSGDGMMIPQKWLVEKRSLTNGSMIWRDTKDLTSTSGSYGDNVSSTAIDSTGAYFIGTAGDQIIRLEKRNLANGSMTWQRNVCTTASVTGAHAGYVTVDNNSIYIISDCGLVKMDKNGNNPIQIVPPPQGPPPYPGLLMYYGITNYAGAIYGGGYSYDGYWRTRKSALGQYFDCGLRVFDGTNIVAFACEPAGTLTSAFRIYKNGTAYGVILVDPIDSYASNVKIQTSLGVKALMELPPADVCSP